jgi:hypothetical protein
MGDLFAGAAAIAAPTADLPDDVATRLAQLAAGPPLWPMDAAHWVDLIARVTAFAWRWDAHARAAGWATLDLYCADRSAPGARVGNLGAAFAGRRILIVPSLGIRTQPSPPIRGGAVPSDYR